MKTLSVLSIIALLLIGCAQQPTTPEKELVTIGVTAPLSGPPALFGQEFMAGLNQALSETDLSGTHFKIVVEDNKNEPKEAIAGYQRLREAGIDMLFAVGSGPAVVIAPLAGEDGIPMLMTIIAAPVNRNNTNTFRYYFVGEETAEALRPHIKEAGFKTAAIYYTNTEAGVNGIRAIEAMFIEEGLDIVAKESHLQTESEHATTLQKIAAKRPDILYVWSARPDQVGAALQETYTGTVVHSELPALTHEFKKTDNYENAYILAPAVTITGTAENTLFTQQLPNAATAYTSFGYDLMLFVSKELEIGVDPKDIVQAIASHDTLTGMAGVALVNKQRRETSIQLQLARVQNKTLVPVEALE